MSSDQIQSNLNVLIELSSSMLAAARQGDWDRVQEIEQQRKTLLDQTVPLDTDSMTDPVVVAEQIRKIADLDKETMRLATESRAELFGLVNKISSGRQAVNAYRDIEGR